MNCHFYPRHRLSINVACGPSSEHVIANNHSHRDLGTEDDNLRESVILFWCELITFFDLDQSKPRGLQKRIKIKTCMAAISIFG
jgi:hypothetical protein